MVSPFSQNQTPVSRIAGSKRSYDAPHLVEFGSLSDITLANGSRGGPDTVVNNTKTKP